MIVMQQEDEHQALHGHPLEPAIIRSVCEGKNAYYGTPLRTGVFAHGKLRFHCETCPMATTSY